MQHTLTEKHTRMLDAIIAAWELRRGAIRSAAAHDGDPITIPVATRDEVIDHMLTCEAESMLLSLDGLAPALTAAEGRGTNG